MQKHVKDELVWIFFAIIALCFAAFVASQITT